MRILLAFALTGLGSSLSILGAATDPGAGGEIATYVQGAGAAAAVSGLAYMARLMATGRLVARDPARVEAALLEINEKMIDLLRSSQSRETDYRELLLRRAAEAEGRRSRARE